MGMAMAAILFNSVEAFKQTINTPWTEGPMILKTGENWSSDFREDVERFQNFIHVYSPEARADKITSGDKILIVTEKFYYLNHTL